MTILLTFFAKPFLSRLFLAQILLNVDSQGVLGRHPLMLKSYSASQWQAQWSLTHLLLIAIALAVVLRIINLGSREFWYDEVLSLLLSTGKSGGYKTPSDIPIVLSQYTALLNLPPESNRQDTLHTVTNLIKGLWGSEPHPPFFFLSQHLWLRLFGNTEAATRSLGAIFSIGTLYSAYGLGKVLLGHRGGLMLAALLGVNPFYLFHSLNFRMYGPLLLWTVLSAWALLELIERSSSQARSFRIQMFWNSLFILSVAAGLLTFYLFAYWVVALGVIILYRDLRHLWQHGVRMGISIALTLPWMIIGASKQFHNVDLKRFGTNQTIWESSIRHAEDLVQTLGIHLLLGDWVTSLPSASALIAGAIGLGLLLTCLKPLWQQANRQTLMVSLLLGVFPLLLALAVDVATRKFTLGFGWGRAVIFVLPGFLLLFVLWFEQTEIRWRKPAAAALVILYLSLSFGDYCFRQRQPFHQITNLVEPSSPTLIVMDSKAWGHVMRLAYYIPPTSEVLLLAQPSSKLAETLKASLTNDSTHVSNVLWLDSARPIWSPASTPIERQQVEQVLLPQFNLVKTQVVTGTMILDQFTVKLYTRS
jgi:uncharacterized membrane protein